MKKLFLSLFVAVVALATLVSCAVVSASSIELDTADAKLEYVVGEELDTTGIKVKVTFSDATTKDVVISSCVVDASGYNKDAAGTYTIKVTYDKVSAEYSVVVKEAEVADPVMVGLEVDASGAKTNYLVGEGLITDGIVVSVKFDNGEVAAYAGEYTVDDSAYNKEAAGTYVIKVSAVVEEVELTGSYEVTVEAIEVPFEGTSYKFVASELPIEGVTDKDEIAVGTKYADYFTIAGKVTHRLNAEATGTTAIEIQKRSTGKLEFVVTGRAFVVLTVSSNGSANTSAFALVDAVSATVENDQQLSLVTGTDGLTVTYTLPAGEYAIVSPNTADYGGRGVRVLAIEVIEDTDYVDPNQGGGNEEVEEPQNRLFDVTTIDATNLADKDAIAGGTCYHDFFYILGTVTARVKEDVEAGTKAVTSLELGKENGGQIKFTLKYAASVSIVAASTAGTNESVIALVNEAGEVVVATIVESETIANDANGITHVTSTAKSTLTYELQPGVYELTSPADVPSLADPATELSRNVRVFSIAVAEKGEVSADPKSYHFEASSISAEGVTDKDTIAAGTVYSEFFTITGSVTQRISSGATKSIELAKNGGGAVAFTLSRKAVVTVVVASTSGSNTSAFAVVDALNQVIAEDAGLTIVEGTDGLTITYTLEAGSYSIISPESEYNRGMRVYSVSVVEQ